MTAENTLFLIIAIIGCFVGLAGWLGKREDNVEENARWRGSVDGKLDAILGIDKRVGTLEESMINVRNDIAFVERTAKKAHERIDEIADEVKKID